MERKRQDQDYIARKEIAKHEIEMNHFLYLPAREKEATEPQKCEEVLQETTYESPNYAWEDELS